MKGWILTVVAGVLLGLVIHLATLILLPALAPAPAYARLGGHPANTFFALADEDRHGDPPVPFLDPKFSRLVCRFSLSDGPLHIHAPTGGSYTALSFYTPEGIPFFALNDRSAVAGALDVLLDPPHDPSPVAEDESQATAVEAPRATGLVVLSILKSAQGDAAAIAAEVAGASCDAPPLPPAPPPPPAAAPEDSLQILRMSPSGGAGAKVVPIPVEPPRRR